MDDENEGEFVDLPDVEDDVEDTADGGAIVRLDDEDDARPADSEFYANLAEEMPEYELASLSTTFLVTQAQRDLLERLRLEVLLEVAPVVLGPLAKAWVRKVLLLLLPACWLLWRLARGSYADLRGRRRLRPAAAHWRQAAVRAFRRNDAGAARPAMRDRRAH